MAVRSQAALPQAGLQSHPAFASQRRFSARLRSHLKQRLLLSVFLLPLLSTSLAAQDTLTAGDKVRVTTEEERIVGSLVSADATQLVLDIEQGDSSLALPLASLTKLEVSRGQKSRTGKGALIGAGVGAAAGVVTGVALCPPGECFTNGNSLTGVVALVFGAGGALLGAGIGALIGSGTKAERWETVPLDRIRVSLTPITPHGLGATVRVRWSP